MCSKFGTAAHPHQKLWRVPREGGTVDCWGKKVSVAWKVSNQYWLCSVLEMKRILYKVCFSCICAADEFIAVSLRSGDRLFYALH